LINLSAKVSPVPDAVFNGPSAPPPYGEDTADVAKIRLATDKWHGRWYRKGNALRTLVSGGG